MLGADASRPCDRPNLSKGFLAGAASTESNPLRPPAFYLEHRIDLKLDAPVVTLDTKSQALRIRWAKSQGTLNSVSARNF